MGTSAEIRLPLIGRRAVPIGLAVLAFVLALLQHPGANTSDTKIDLHVDPLHFLSQVASVWSPTAGLGHVQGGQYSGYLWPMAPFFALGHLLGLSSALTERLWLGSLLALAAWGAVKLTDALLDRRRGVAHIVSGLAYMVNPYVVVFTSRTTVFLLAYAALPWLMLTVHRGVRTPRSWWRPAAFALLTTSTAGGVNATVTAMALIGPVLLALHEAFFGEPGRRAVLAFAWRAVVASFLASVWWVVPLLVQSRYGLNFLQFTEQLGSIWAPTSLTESLRLMGYWPSYLGVGYGSKLTPYYGDAGTLLFNPAVVLASLLVPGLALGGYAQTRRWRYAPFLLGCALVTLVLMSVAWPNGTPGRHGASFFLNHLSAIQFLRTTYKAGPLLALSIALLGGAAVQLAWRRRGLTRPVLLTAVGAGLVLSALPLFQGRALELTWSRIPVAWRQAASDLDAQLPPNSRALVLPGQAFAFYNWGGTVDPILPSLTRRPVAIRNVPPYDDLHAVDMLWTVDDLVQQGRLLPGQLPPLLDLMSSRAVITASDDNSARSGAVVPAAAARELAGQPGFGRPSRSYGALSRFASPSETADPGLALPEVRRYDLRARGLVRVESAQEPTIVDGSASGVADMAALNELPAQSPLLLAGDQSGASIRAQASAGADVVITDSNRRRAFVASRTRQNVGWTLSAAEAFSPDAARLDPFPQAGADAQTVAAFTGARYVTAPYDAQVAEFPEHSPYAAFDGDPRTSWLADTTLDESRHWVEVGLNRARDVPYIDVLEDQNNPLVAITQVAVNGHRFPLHRGWNRLPVSLHRATAVRVAIASVHSLGANTGSAGGFAEIRIPGVAIHELLRPPVLVQDALRGANLAHTGLSYIFERTTADEPLRRGPPPQRTITHGDRLQAEAALVRLAQDAETGIARMIDPPVARRWTLSGLATTSPTAADSALDRLAGDRTAGAVLDSSGRLEGWPSRRASAAFDGSIASAWVAPLSPEQPAWIAWRTPRPHLIDHLTLTRSSLPVRFPTLLGLGAGRHSALRLVVSPTGEVTLPHPLRARSFRLQVLAATGSARAAVGIAEISGSGVPRVRPSPPTGGLRGGCGELSVHLGTLRVPLRAYGTVAQLDAGSPLHLQSCRAIALPAAQTEFQIAAGRLRPLVVSLRSPAPDPLARAAVVSGAVIDSGRRGTGNVSGVRVDVHGPAWLVLGESYNRGWQAICNGRSLGPPAVIDAFANGWRIGPGCRQVSMTFSPQRLVTGGFLIGAVACVVLILVLLLGWHRGRVWRVPTLEGSEAPPGLGWEAASPWPAARAAVAGALAAAAFGFGFGLRTGALIGPAYALLLWRGVATRRLALAAGALLVLAVPTLYLVTLGHDQGGYDTGYATQHLAAHWVAVGAFALLALAVIRDLSRARAHASRARRHAPGRELAPPGRV